MATRLSTIWIDGGNKTRLTQITANASPSGIQGAILAVSNAGIVSDWQGTVNSIGGVPTVAQYEGVADYAALLFGAADGSEVRLVVPAPKASIFLADQQTVDPTQIAALIAACIGTLVTNTAAAVTTYLGGVRERSGRSFP